MEVGAHLATVTLRTKRSRAAHPLLAALVLAVAGCDSITLWFAPNTTCADWQHMADDRRSTITDQLIRGSSLFEAVRVAQHAPAGTPEDQLVAMAIASITKNCEAQTWSAAVLVKDIVRDLYVPARGGAAT